MKKIIEGKLYNTETAKKVAEYNNGYYPNDFNFMNEELYQKKTGEFFLYGEGGALSKYATSSGNSSGWGWQIIPMTENKAMQWVEKHADADSYIEIFGEPKE
jgi:hypothetical protein